MVRVIYGNGEVGTKTAQTIYARWKVKNYTLSFDSQGGTPYLDRSPVWDDTSLISNNVLKNNYIFDGWYTQPNGWGYENRINYNYGRYNFICIWP